MSADGIGLRISELMDGDGRKQNLSAFARKCGLAESLVRKYLTGSIPSADRAALIARANGVSLEWLITGEGEKYPSTPGFSDNSQSAYHAGPPAADERTASIDAELMGRVVDRIARVYKDEHVHLQHVDLGRLAAEHYEQIKGLAGDPEEWPALLDLTAVRLRRAIRESAADPASAKRGA